VFVISHEENVEKWDIAGFLPTQSFKKFSSGAKFPPTPHVNVN